MSKYFDEHGKYVGPMTVKHRLTMLFGGKYAPSGNEQECCLYYKSEIGMFFSRLFYRMKSRIIIFYYDAQILYYKTKIRLRK